MISRTHTHSFKYVRWCDHCERAPKSMQRNEECMHIGSPDSHCDPETLEWWCGCHATDNKINETAVPYSEEILLHGFGPLSIDLSAYQPTWQRIPDMQAAVCKLVSLQYGKSTKLQWDKILDPVVTDHSTASNTLEQSTTQKTRFAKSCAPTKRISEIRLSRTYFTVAISNGSFAPRIIRH